MRQKLGLTSIRHGGEGKFAPKIYKKKSTSKPSSKLKFGM